MNRQIDEKVNQNDESLEDMAEELRKLREEVGPLHKEKKTGPVVIPPGLSVSNDPVLNDSLKFIFISIHFSENSHVRQYMYVFYQQPQSCKCSLRAATEKCIQLTYECFRLDFQF